MRNRKELDGRESRARGPWSDLPKELLEIIANSLLTREDVCRFRAVCKSWRSSVPPFRKPIHFIDPTIESTVYHVQPSSFRNSQASTSTSTSTPWGWGWLVKVTEQEAGRFRVLNLLSSQPSHSFPNVINLLDFRVSELAKAYSPHFPNNDGTCKVVFSSSPDDCPCPSFMRIDAAGVLFYLKIGDSEWTLIDDMVSQMDYEDVTLHKNRFCAVDKYGRAVVIDSSSLKVIEIASPFKGENNGDRKILVESAGELLLVERLCKKRIYFLVERLCTNSYYFKVFKLKEKEKEWVEVKSLDDKVMFLGGDCSFCVPAKDFGNGCKGNCIFFTDRCFTVFNLEDGSLIPVQRHPGYNKIFYPPPQEL